MAIIKLANYIEYIHTEGLVSYWRNTKTLKLNKWSQELESK